MTVSSWPLCAISVVVAASPRRHVAAAAAPFSATTMGDCQSTQCTLPATDWACYCDGGAQDCRIRSVFITACVIGSVGLLSLLASGGLCKRLVTRADPYMSPCCTRLGVSAAFSFGFVAVLWGLLALIVSLDEASRTDEFNRCNLPDSPVVAITSGLVGIVAFAVMALSGALCCAPLVREGYALNDASSAFSVYAQPAPAPAPDVVGVYYYPAPVQPSAPPAEGK
jgi:hypothetical protein